MLFLCCFDFVEICYEKLISQQFTRKPTNFFNYIDFIQKLNLVDLQTQGATTTFRSTESLGKVVVAQIPSQK